MKFFFSEIFFTNSLITRDFIKATLTSFLDSYFEKNPDKFIAIFPVIEFENQIYKSLSKVNVICKKDVKNFVDAMMFLWDLKADNSHSQNTINFIIRYRLLDGNNVTKIQSTPPDNQYPINKKFTEFKGYKLPNHTDVFHWGKFIKFEDGLLILEYKDNPQLELHIDCKNRSNVVTIKNDDFIVLKFEDFKDLKSNNNSNFRRLINNEEFVYINGNIVLKYHKKNVTFIEPTLKNKEIDNNIITMDIETRTINNQMLPYCICTFDGVNKRSYYLTDFNNSDEMLTKAITDLLTKDYNRHVVYIHNLSHFDGVFLVRILGILQKSDDNIKIKITKRDSSIINIGISCNEMTLHIRDSLSMLPSSLRSLAKSFKVEDKSIFPYNFVNNKAISLDYVGPVPRFTFFDKITIKEYYTYERKFKNNWSLRDETIKYCLQDCITLHQILIKFNSLIYRKFKVNINRYPTLPSLAFGIFRTNFLGYNLNLDRKIPILVGEIYDFIKKSYTGGAVDMYIPHSKEKMYCYDVNSLYPFVMATNDMPLGEPKHFTINNLPDSDFDFISYYKKEFGEKPFGFFKAKITSPTKLKHPIIQTKIKTPAGLRTVAPLGTWTDVIFSEEMYNAEKLGYKFEIQEGYIFKRGNIFKNYITTLYKIKENSEKSDPMYLISKLLMNSLYGRFGMDYKMDEHSFVNKEELTEIIQNKFIELSNPIQIEDDLFLISFLDLKKYENVEIDHFHEYNISVSIASSISAYARIHMSQFKNNKKYKIFYSDTDSIYINKKLHKLLVSNTELGKLKLENIFTESTFLAPKVYGGRLESGEEIIKVKGLRHDVIDNQLTLDKLNFLLHKNNSLNFTHTKTFRNFDSGTINLMEQTYNLVATENKRELVYKNDVMVNTKPIRIK